MGISTAILCVKALINLAAIALLFFVRRITTGELKNDRRWILAILFLLACVSLVAYFDFGYYPKHGSFLNPHDFTHYYLGSKYSHELGYRNIYGAMVIADYENHGRLRYTTLRSQDTYEYEFAANVVRQARRYKEPFSPERWAAFKQDVAYFESITKPERWPGVVKDKGYNATPVWNMVAGFLTNNVASTDTNWGMPLLLCLDLILMGMALTLLGRAFGMPTALFALIFFTTQYTMSYPHIRGAFLRLDWIAALLMAAAFLKTKRHGYAGVACAYAASARIFPLLFVFGIGARWIWVGLKSLRSRDFASHKPYLQFFTALILITIILVGGSVLYDGGLEHWQDFWAKILMHNDDLSPSRVGFKYLFLGTWENDIGDWAAFEDREVDEFAGHQIVWYRILTGALVLTWLAVRKLKDYQALAISYVVVFMLTAPTFYYHAMLLVPLLLFLPTIERPSHALGATLFFGFNIAGYGLSIYYGAGQLNLTLSYILSAMLLGLCGYMLLVGIFTRADKVVEQEKPS